MIKKLLFKLKKKKIEQNYSKYEDSEMYADIVYCSSYLKMIQIIGSIYEEEEIIPFKDNSNKELSDQIKYYMNDRLLGLSFIVIKLYTEELITPVIELVNSGIKMTYVEDTILFYGDYLSWQYLFRNINNPDTDVPRYIHVLYNQFCNVDNYSGIDNHGISKHFIKGDINDDIVLDIYSYDEDISFVLFATKYKYLVDRLYDSYVFTIEGSQNLHYAVQNMYFVACTIPELHEALKDEKGCNRLKEHISIYYKEDVDNLNIEDNDKYYENIDEVLD